MLSDSISLASMSSLIAWKITTQNKPKHITGGPRKTRVPSVVSVGQRRRRSPYPLFPPHSPYADATTCPLPTRVSSVNLAHFPHASACCQHNRPTAEASPPRR